MKVISPDEESDLCINASDYDGLAYHDPVIPALSWNSVREDWIETSQKNRH